MMIPSLALAAETFGRMSAEQRETVVWLHERHRPLVAGPAGEAPPLPDSLGLLIAVTASGRRLWMLNVLGYLVLGYCLQWRDAQRRAATRAAG